MAIKLTWLDWIFRPTLNIFRQLLKAILAGVISFFFALLPLYLTGTMQLATQPLIVGSCIGIFWVCCFSFILPLQKKIMGDLRDVEWGEGPSLTDAENQYRSFLNAHWLVLTLTIIAWSLLMLTIYINLNDPALTQMLDIQIGALPRLAPPEMQPFMFSAGIATFLGGLLAVTTGIFLLGQVRYARCLKQLIYHGHLSDLRTRLNRLVYLTGWSAFFYSTGIAVILLSTRTVDNVLSLLVILAVASIVIYSFWGTLRFAQDVYDKALKRVSTTIRRELVNHGTYINQELAIETLHRLSRPLIEPPKVGTIVVSIALPLILTLSDPYLQHLLR